MCQLSMGHQKSWKKTVSPVHEKHVCRHLHCFRIATQHHVVLKRKKMFLLKKRKSLQCLEGAKAGSSKAPIRLLISRRDHTKMEVITAATSVRQLALIRVARVQREKCQILCKKTVNRRKRHLQPALLPPTKHTRRNDRTRSE